MKRIFIITLAILAFATSVNSVSAAGVSGHAGICIAGVCLKGGGGVSMGMNQIHHFAQQVAIQCKAQGVDHAGCADANKIISIAKKHLK